MTFRDRLDQDSCRRREFAILKLIWEHGPLTVRQIREHLTTDEEIPYTSVLTLVE